MAKTVLDAFNIAMALTDNMTDNEDYLERAVHVVNALLPELYQASDTKILTLNTKPVPLYVTALTSTLNIDDALAIGVLPHGMIAMLLTDDVTIANFHQQLYEQKLRKLSQVPSEFEAITDVYGALNYSESYVE